MKLADLLKPEDGKKDNTMSLRKLVRQKSFKTMVKAIAKKNNPGDETRNSMDIVGDGGRDESPTDNSTVDLL